MLWRKSLTEEQVRSMAVDYKRGLTDQCNADAFAEFCLRFPEEAPGADRKSKKSKKRRASRYA